MGYVDKGVELKVIDVIETNLNFTNKGLDHESRIIHAESWEGLIKSLNDWDGESDLWFETHSSHGGPVIRKGWKLYNLVFDDCHATCEVSSLCFSHKKLFSLVV